MLRSSCSEAACSCCSTQSSFNRAPPPSGYVPGGEAVGHSQKHDLDVVEIKLDKNLDLISFSFLFFSFFFVSRSFVIIGT
jgi:hypothetical protein